MKRIFFIITLFFVSYCNANAQLNWFVSEIGGYDNWDVSNPSDSCLGDLFQVHHDTLIVNYYYEPGAGCPTVYRKTLLQNDSIYLHYSNVDTPYTCTLDDRKICVKLKVLPLSAFTNLKVNLNLNLNYADTVSGIWYNIHKVGNSISFNDFVVPISNFNLVGIHSDDKNSLYWSCHSSVGKEFVIERSLDGKQFETINKQTITHSTNETDQFSYSEFTANQSYYYRIKFIDIENHAAFSNIIYLKNILNTSISILQNPILNNNVNLVFKEHQNDFFEISVSDLSGRVILNETFSPSDNDCLFQHHLNTSITGMVLILVKNIDTNEIKVFKASIL